MRLLYTFLVYLFAPLLWWQICRRSPKGKCAWRQRLGWIKSSEQSVLWIHAASVGEVLAARPLIAALEKKYPDLPLLVTTITSSGAHFVKTSFKDRVRHEYFPIDTPDAVKRFTQRAKPKAVIFLETELWPNTVALLNKKNIPYAIVNARMSDKSFPRYQFFSRLTKKMLQKASLVAAQSEQDFQRYRLLGAPPQHLVLTGNIKYDLVLPANLEMEANRFNQLWMHRPVWLVASSRDDEEAIILNVFKRLQQDHPNLLLAIVPRHPQRFDEVAKLVEAQDLNLIRRSEGRECEVSTHVFLGDSMGELLPMYQAANVIFMGGSLVDCGGHNPLEPAAVSKAVVVGPSVENFAEIYTTLKQHSAVVSVTDTDELAISIHTILCSSKAYEVAGQAAQAVVRLNQGAIDKTLDALESRVTL